MPELFVTAQIEQHNVPFHQQRIGNRMIAGCENPLRSSIGKAEAFEPRTLPGDHPGDDKVARDNRPHGQQRPVPATASLSACEMAPSQFAAGQLVGPQIVAIVHQQVIAEDRKRHLAPDPVGRQGGNVRTMSLEALIKIKLTHPFGRIDSRGRDLHR